MDGEEEDDEEEFDWQVEQEVYMDSSEEQLKELQKYGFGSQRSGVFTRLQVRSFIGFGSTAQSHTVLLEDGS